MSLPPIRLALLFVFISLLSPCPATKSNFCCCDFAIVPYMHALPCSYYYRKFYSPHTVFHSNIAIEFVMFHASTLCFCAHNNTHVNKYNVYFVESKHFFVYRMNFMNTYDTNTSIGRILAYDRNVNMSIQKNIE